MNLVLLVATLALRVVLTFDDGYRDHALIAVPELEKRGWRGTFNVVTGLVGGGEYLSWEDVRDLNRRGHEVATHTVGHPNLVALLEEGKTNEVRRQLVESRDQIVARAGFAPRYLCPPFNKRNDVTDRICGEESLCPMRIPRCNFGGRNPKDVRDVVTNALARGVRRLDLLHHGISAADHGGWCPFPDRAAFVRHLDRIAELEREGLIVVTDYEGCASEYPLDSRAWPHHADGACCASGGMSEAEEVAFQHAFIRNHGLAPKVEEKFSRNRHPDAQWYPKAGLGMFVHWGIYAVDGYHEQQRMRQRLGRAEYAERVKGFTAAKFDPDRWIDVAESAGAEYIVFTAKHHDGFCMWDTRTTDFKVTNSPAKRDVLRELADACRRRGMKLGLYYSNPDWNHPNAYNPKSTHQVPPEAGDVPDLEKYREYVKTQIAELLTDYGEIVCLFWDIPTKVPAPEMDEMVRRLQPGIRINDRGWGNVGDYSTPERGLPDGAAFTRPTEACDSVGAQSWGYRANEDYHTLGYLTSAIDRTLARGGNFLLNVDPKADGTIPPESAALMAGVGNWYRKVRESYGGVESVTGLVADARCIVTKRDNALYLHYADGLDATGVDLKPMKKRPKSVTLLNTGVPLEFAVETMPRNWDGAGESLHLRGMPVNALAGESVVIRLDDERPGR